MAKRKSIYGLSPGQLTRLLDVSAKATQPVDLMSEDQTRSALLRERLDRRLSDDRLLQEALGTARGQSESGFRTLLDRSLREVLLTPGGDPVLLRALKDEGKRLSGRIASGHENQIGVALYHAAIASALVHQGQRITRYSYEVLERHFSTLAEQIWMVGELRTLFAQAAADCQRRMHSE